jgi:hypothetical protein
VGRKGEPPGPSSEAPDFLGVTTALKTIDIGSSVLTWYDGAYHGILQNSKVTMEMEYNRVIENADFSAGDIRFYDDVNTKAVYAHKGPTTGFTTVFMSTGARATPSPTGLGTGETLCGGLMANGYYVFAYFTSGGAYKFYFVNPSTLTVSGVQTFDSGAESLVDIYVNALDESKVYGVTSTSVRLFNLSFSTGSASSTVLGTPASTAGGTSSAVDPSTGYLWSVKRASGTVAYSVFSPSALVASGTAAASFSSLARQPLLFTGGNVYVVGQRWLSIVHWAWWNSDGAFQAQFDATHEDDSPLYVGINVPNAAWFNDATNTVTIVQENLYYGTTVGSSPDMVNGHALSMVGYLAGAGTTTGTGTIGYQNLPAILTDLSERAGLSADQIDVSDPGLDVQVDGYIIANQVSVKDAISLLMPAYYFDAAEDQGKIKFVKRGGDIAVVIPDDDLGAHPSDQEGSDLYETTRVMDEELPSTLSVNYVLAATKYSPASKYARRLVGYSGDEQRMEFAMVFTDEKALHIAHVNLHDQWISRLRRKLSLGLEYAYLMPTDLIGVGGYGMRITQMTQKGAYFEIECVRDDSDTYTPNIIVTETPPPDETVSEPSLTLLELM